MGNFATTGLNAPAGLAFDKRGNLYVSNRGDNTIRVFSRTGEDLGYFARPPGWSVPFGLAFSPDPEDEDDDEDGDDDGPLAHLIRSIVTTAGL